MNKKAISPLIATVLLIAFAVALGTIVMNWGLGAVQDAQKDPCADIALELERMQQPTSICFDSQQRHIKYSVVNTGQTPLASIRLRFVDASLEPQVYDVEVDLGIGAALSESRAYQPTTNTEIYATIAPVVTQADQVVVCSQPALQGLPVRQC